MLEGEVQNEFRFGLKQRIYNWTMRRAREAKGWRQTDLAAACGVSYGTISNIETLRKFPKREQAEKIAGALGRDVDALFPEWLKEFRLQAVPMSNEEESITLAEALDRKLIASGSLLNAGWEEEVELQADLSTIVPELLATLEPLERRVIELGLGLGSEEMDEDGLHYGYSKTLEEVGTILCPNLSRERIRQIEGKALWKLRHPTRSQRLRGLTGRFLDEE